MATQFSTLLKLALPVQGELSGTWGDLLNNSVTNMVEEAIACLLYTSPSPRDGLLSRMPSSA